MKFLCAILSLLCGVIYIRIGRSAIRGRVLYVNNVDVTHIRVFALIL